jgi:hypothetical protein
MTGTIHYPTDVRVENRCLTRAGKVARKPWCVFVNDEAASRRSLLRVSSIASIAIAAFCVVYFSLQFMRGAL